MTRSASTSRDEPAAPADAASSAEPTDPEADPESVARQILLRRLTDRPRSRAELAETLARRDVPTEVATRLLDRFEEVGLVDDEEFARTWVRSRLDNKGLARRALGVELRRKGISDEIVRAVLDEVDADEETEVARRLVRRKLRSTQGLDEQVRTRRLVGMLGRKGYSPGLALGVVRDELGAEASDDAIVDD